MQLLLVLAALLSAARCYNILCVFPVPYRSNNQLGMGMVNTLLEAGHKVTWTTPFPETIMDLRTTRGLYLIDVSATRLIRYSKASEGIFFMQTFYNNVSREVLANPEVRDAIINTQFDAVVTEAFFLDVLAGLAAVQQVPWLLLSRMPMTPSLEAQVDEVRSISTVPFLFNDSDIPMSFKDRLVNTLVYIGVSIVEWLERTSTNNLYETLFAPLAKARGVPLPAFAEALHNVSVLFVNSHESLTPALSTPPNVVNIAGYHIDEEIPPLPKDLQDLLDHSPKGVVYFNMGSVIRSSTLLNHTRDAMLAHFAGLEQTVLWKFKTKIEGLPRNVHVRPWMPQPGILAHPNVRVFITHGGLLSTLEAVNAGVPLLVVPVFGEQHANAGRAVRAGYARRVRFSEDMADELDENIKEMLGNDTYKNKVMELSKLFRTRPVSPAKLITHYVELAIETKGTFHLRSLSQKYSWYQRWMLDQLAYVLVILVILVKLVLIIVRTCVKKLTGVAKQKQK